MHMQISHHEVVRVPSPGSIHVLSLEESDQIRKTLGATPIYVLRQSYGAGFAPDMPGDVTLAQAMDHIDISSITLLVRHLTHRGGDELNRM
jgi:hypothetical protein